MCVLPYFAPTLGTGKTGAHILNWIAIFTASLQRKANPYLRARRFAETIISRSSSLGR